MTNVEWRSYDGTFMFDYIKKCTIVLYFFLALVEQDIFCYNIFRKESNHDTSNACEFRCMWAAFGWPKTPFLYSEL